MLKTKKAAKQNGRDKKKLVGELELVLGRRNVM